MAKALSSKDYSFAAPERNNGAAFRKELFPAPYAAEERPVGDRFMVTVDKGQPCLYHVFLLHGGGYVMEAMSMHTDKVRKLADLGLRVTAFAYPLAPEHTMDEIHEAVAEAFDLLRAAYPHDTFAVYGDSAGGGLGLNLLMRLRDRGDENRPMKSVWVSPALDMTMENPDIALYKDGDKSLNYVEVKGLGAFLANGGDVKQPKFSPLYGDLNGLGDMLLFYGGREILRPDCEKLAAKELTGTTIQAVMAPKAYHDYLMMVGSGYPPAQEAFTMIGEFLR